MIWASWSLTRTDDGTDWESLGVLCVFLTLALSDDDNEPRRNGFLKNFPRPLRFICGSQRRPKETLHKAAANSRHIVVGPDFGSNDTTGHSLRR